MATLPSCLTIGFSGVKRVQTGLTKIKFDSIFATIGRGRKETLHFLGQNIVLSEIIATNEIAIISIFS